jgi:hypothetical protein
VASAHAPPLDDDIAVVATPVDLDRADLREVGIIAARCGIRREG